MSTEQEILRDLPNLAPMPAREALEMLVNSRVKQFAITFDTVKESDTFLKEFYAAKIKWDEELETYIESHVNISKRLELCEAGKKAARKLVVVCSAYRWLKPFTKIPGIKNTEK